VNTRDGFWLGAVVDALDDAAKKGCRVRNVRTWLAT
jgi:hypothetical protein